MKACSGCGEVWEDEHFGFYGKDRKYVRPYCKKCLKLQRKRQMESVGKAPDPNLKYKKCHACQELLPVECFYVWKLATDGYRGTCKACIAKKGNEYYASYVYRDRWYKKSYGITLEEYDSLLSQQNNVCGICGKAETRMAKGGVRELSVDHCHETGRVRGLLCNKCNIALGHFDDVALLRKAIAWIQAGSLQDLVSVV